MKLVCFCIMTFFYCVGLSSAWAFEQNENNVLNKRITIYGGVRIYDADGTFSSTREGSPVIKIDMDDLGLDENATSAIGGFIYNFGKRWNLRFDYFGFHDDGRKMIDKSFNFDGEEFPIGATVKSSLDIDLYVVNLAYNIVHTERARLGIGLGVHGLDFDLKGSATISVNGSEVEVADGRENFLAPVPNIWIYGVYAITERFMFRYSGGWMSASYDDYDGDLLLANAAVEYWPFKNTGFGAGYSYISADIDYEPGYKKEDYDVDLPGVVFYVTFGF